MSEMNVEGRLYARLVSLPTVTGGAALLVKETGGAVRVTDVLDRVLAGDDVEELAEDFGLTPDSVRLVIRLEADLEERRRAYIPTKAKGPVRRSERPLLSETYIASNHRRRVIEGALAALASQGFKNITVAHIVAEAHTSRNTFYKAFRGKEEVLKAAIDWVTEECLTAFDADGIDGILTWSAAHPGAIRAVLLEGQADVAKYQEALDRVAERYQGPGAIAAVEGMATVAAQHLRQGSEVDTELLNELKTFGGMYA